MHIHCGYTILHGTLTCSGTEVVGWGSSGNGSLLLFDDGRFDPAPSDTKTRKRYIATEVQTQLSYHYISQATVYL